MDNCVEIFKSNRESLEIYWNYIQNMDKFMMDVLRTEDEIAANLKKVEEYAEKHNIHVVIDKGYNISKGIRENLGIWLRPGYNSELKKYSAWPENLINIFYAIRDSFGLFWFYKNAKIQEGKSINVIWRGSSTGLCFLKEWCVKTYKSDRWDYIFPEKDLENLKKCRELIDNIERYLYKERS